MSNIEIELNSAGIEALLKSGAMQGVLMKHAKTIAGNSSDVEPYIASTRAGVAVCTKKTDGNSLLRGMRKK